MWTEMIDTTHLLLTRTRSCVNITGYSNLSRSAITHTNYYDQGENKDKA